MSTPAIAKALKPVLDGLPELEAEAAAKADEVTLARKVLRAAGLLEQEAPKARSSQRRDGPRSASEQTLEIAWKAVDTKWGEAGFTATQLSDKTGLSKDRAYAAIEHFYEEKKLRKLGRRRVSDSSPAKAAFYARIKEG